ncbi:MAG: phosphoenolpyruvate carboxylase [Thermoflavifilum sp.]|nr:phosphoenolpyruvate carboxylase [Thermoflavifilum sp.]
MNGQQASLNAFRNLVAMRFQLYNSLFSALPFHRVEKTGVLLSMFIIFCEESYQRGLSPTEIIEQFISKYTEYQTEKDSIDLLFRFIQYAERQVVLFDALEDAAFGAVNDLNGKGTLKHLLNEVQQQNAWTQLREKLKHFSVRIVLTAHPTQFYPSEVLGIIHDLSQAIMQDNTALVNTYLQQLGKTPFFKKQKPTPYDEAMNLIWYLEHVFYPAVGKILTTLRSHLNGNDALALPVPIRLGFWPGGDRDGNPYVTVDITLKVADALRNAILVSYYRDVRKLRRRLTFKGISGWVAELEELLYQHVFEHPSNTHLCVSDIREPLLRIRQQLIAEHNGLFVGMVEELLHKVDAFGLFFASLDIRQDSSIHRRVVDQIVAKGNVLPAYYHQLSEAEKLSCLSSIGSKLNPTDYEDPLVKDTLGVMAAMRDIQYKNGEAGCHRYIISHATSATDIIEVYGLFLMSGWAPEQLTVDIVPLFETIEDLQHASQVMHTLYAYPPYREHLKRRGDKQTIMLGFSDGTKDGGYLMANWSIYKAKEVLTRISREFGVHVIFFDGRGGPPARGGGKTHQFYASMGQNIANDEIQLTVQGQTISSNFGTTTSAQYNLEQLMHAGISNGLFASRRYTFTAEEEQLLERLAAESFQAFQALKNHPDFLDYLNYASPLRYYAETNIASRPSSRNRSAKLNLNDLRAVPYVGSWSQIKQNVPGYYGVGTALEALYREGKWKALQELYQNSLFFRTLLDNCEMSMKKSFFPLTAYLAHHPRFGKIWNMLYAEYEKTRKYLLLLSGANDLMQNYPVEQLSIQMRERIMLPLLTIQQYALSQIRSLQEKKAATSQIEVYEKLAIRCSFGIINASRNSA